MGLFEEDVYGSPICNYFHLLFILLISFYKTNLISPFGTYAGYIFGHLGTNQNHLGGGKFS